MTKQRFFIGLFLVLLVSFWLRIFQVNQLSLYWEEAALGYDAYSIGLTGKDHHGNAFPFPVIPSFGDFKPAGYVYALIPFIQTLGLTDLAVRLPSILAGTLIVGLVYLVSYRFFGFFPALIGSLIAAVQPWGFHLSRVGFEANFATCLILLAVYLILMRSQRLVSVLISVALLIYSMATYHSAKIVVPLLVIVLFLYLRSTKSSILRWKNMLVIGIVGLLLSAPMMLSFMNPDTNIRASQTVWVVDGTEVELSNELREQDNSDLGWIFSHRYTLFTQRFIHEYLKGFSLDFFFLNGDHNPRHQSPYAGVLHLWDVVLIPLGVLAFWKKNKRITLLFLSMIAISAIPQALTTLSPHTLRFATAYPVFMLLSAGGVYQVWGWYRKAVKKNIFADLNIGGAVAMFLAWQITSYLYGYFSLYPRLSSTEWQSGYSEMVSGIQDLSPDEPVFITREQGRPAMFVWFYNRVDPRLVQEAGVDSEKDQLEYLEFERYRFVDEVTSDMRGIIVSSPRKLKLHQQESAIDVEMLLSITDRFEDNVWVVWRQQ